MCLPFPACRGRAGRQAPGGKNRCTRLAGPSGAGPGSDANRPPVGPARATNRLRAGVPVGVCLTALTSAERHDVIYIGNTIEVPRLTLLLTSQLRRAIIAPLF